MAKLYFRYGCVGSAKTLNLLAVAHNYRSQGKQVKLIKPSLDTRFGKIAIKSRAGLEADADILIEENTDLSSYCFANIQCILVDEVQFLSTSIINQLRSISICQSIPIICYGLRADFRTHLFPGSRRLMEVADSIEEIKSTCHYCNSKATVNLKLVNGKPSADGPSIELGAEEKYLGACFSCYNTKLAEIKSIQQLEPMTAK